MSDFPLQPARKKRRLLAAEWWAGVGGICAVIGLVIALPAFCSSGNQGAGVTPPLVNGHTHAAMTLFRGFGQKHAY